MTTEIQPRLKAHLVDLLLILLIGLTGLGSGLWASDVIKDDAMITFRVAENLASGRGFVYNLGERIQVTTTPLYTMILALGTWLFGTAPRTAQVLNVSLAALGPVLAYDVGRRLAGRLTGLGGALLLTIMPLLIIAFSMESYLYVVLILAAMDAYVSGRYHLAGILGGMTALVRGDAALLAASMISYDLLESRRLRWSLIIPAITIPAAWYIFATVYYGWPFPATLAAKTAQGEFNWLGEYFLSGFEEYWEDWIEDYSSLFYLFPFLLSIGLGRAIWSRPVWLILVVRDLLYIGTFVGLGVTFAEWYYAPLMPGIALLTARGIQFMAKGTTNVMLHIVTRYGQFAPSSRVSHIKVLLSYGLAVTMITTLLVTIYPVTNDIIKANPDWKAQAYPEVARWIAKNTNVSANLATIDIGHLGYWSNRHIIDIVGLAQPDVASHIAEGDFGYAIRAYQPDMILIGATWLPEIQNRAWFQASYTPRHALKLTALDEPLVLFTRHTGVKVQGQTVPPIKIQPLHVDFNRQITLTGYHINQPTSPGSNLNLTLYWQVEAPLEIDFTVFTQLVDADDNIIAQVDARPQNGFYPTLYWQPGEQIIDTYHLPLSPDTPAGSYAMLLGFYDSSNGARLQILDTSGQFQSDHVRLTGIMVQAP